MAQAVYVSYMCYKCYPCLDSDKLIQGYVNDSGFDYKIYVFKSFLFTAKAKAPSMDGLTIP